MNLHRRMTPVEAKLNELIEEAYDELHLDGMLETDPPIPARPRSSGPRHLLVRARDALGRATPHEVLINAEPIRNAIRLIDQALQDIPANSPARAPVKRARGLVIRRNPGDLKEAIGLLGNAISALF